MTKQYGFIVDTNKYSGNFERQMCAFMTGQMGDCGVGYEEACIFDKEVINKSIIEFFEENILQVKDENGTCRPCEIETTPNIYNNGLGFDYVKGEEELALQKYKECVKKDEEAYINNLKLYIGKGKMNWSDEDINIEIDGHKKKIEEVQNLKEVRKLPAYHSVVIYFDSEIDKEIIDFLKQRAYEFAKNHEDDLIITGFRLYEKEIITFRKYEEV